LHFTTYIKKKCQFVNIKYIERLIWSLSKSTTGMKKKYQYKANEQPLMYS